MAVVGVAGVARCRLGRRRASIISLLFRSNELGCEAASLADWALGCVADKRRSKPAGSHGGAIDIAIDTEAQFAPTCPDCRRGTDSDGSAMAAF